MNINIRRATCTDLRRSNLIVGYVLAEIDEEPDESCKTPHGRVTWLTVRRSCRRKGVAKRLMDQSARAMVEMRSVRYVFLHVGVSNNAAIRLFRNINFDECERKPRYYPDGEEASMMRRSLLQFAIANRVHFFTAKGNGADKVEKIAWPAAWTVNETSKAQKAALLYAAAYNIDWNQELFNESIAGLFSDLGNREYIRGDARENTMLTAVQETSFCGLLIKASSCLHDDIIPEILVDKVTGALVDEEWDCTDEKGKKGRIDVLGSTDEGETVMLGEFGIRKNVTSSGFEDALNEKTNQVRDYVKVLNRYKSWKRVIIVSVVIHVVTNRTTGQQKVSVASYRDIFTRDQLLPRPILGNEEKGYGHTIRDPNDPTQRSVLRITFADRAGGSALKNGIRRQGKIAGPTVVPTVVYYPSC